MSENENTFNTGKKPEAVLQHDYILENMEAANHGPEKRDFDDVDSQPNTPVKGAHIRK